MLIVGDDSAIAEEMPGAGVVIVGAGGGLEAAGVVYATVGVAVGSRNEIGVVERLVCVRRRCV